MLIFVEVDPLVKSGDYRDGFLLGTPKALYENGRESVTLTLKPVSPVAVGVLIALFERAVGLYATLINVNAYHQPGVEAGKRAAGIGSRIVGAKEALISRFRKLAPANERSSPRPSPRTRRRGS